MSIAEFYIMNGLDPFNNEFDDDYYDFFYDGYDSDYLYDYNDYRYGFSDSEYSACDSDDFFLEMCLPSRHFPDKKQFPVEWVRRAMSMKSDNLHALTALPLGESISDKLELPLLEQLWESLSYLKEIVSFGMLRVQNTDHKVSDADGHSSRGIDIWKSSIECFSSLPKDAQNIADQWFHWCNDLYIDTLQSLTPAGLPYIVWVSIVKHLSRERYSESRTLHTQIGTVYEDNDNKIIERFLLRNCILRVTELIRIFYRCLFGELEWMDITINKIKFSIPALLQGFNLSMNRLSQFLDSTLKPTSTFLDYSLSKTFTMDMGEFVCDETDEVSCPDEFDLLKVVQADLGNQNSSRYFAMLTAHDEEVGAYNLLCISKDSLDTPLNSEDYFSENASMISTECPLLFCSENLVAGLGVNDQKSLRLTVWDMSEKSCRYYGREIGEKWKEVFPEIWPISLSDLKIKGINKCSNTMTVVFQVKNSCLIAKYDLIVSTTITKCDLKDSSVKAESDFQKGPSHFRLQQNQLNLFENSYPLGYRGTTAYVMNMEENQSLELVDLNNPDDPSYKIDIESGTNWKMQFDSDPSSDLCILYKDSKVQVRRLDQELTLVKELTLNLSYLTRSPIPKNLELHFFNSTVYGFIENQAHTCSMKEDYLKQTPKHERCNLTLDHFLQDRLLNTAGGKDLHFLCYIDTAEQELLCLDWENDHFNARNDFGEGYLFSEEIPLEKALVGFNSRGEVVKLSADSNIENFYLDSDKTAVVCDCFGLSFSIINIHTAMKDAKDMWLPNVQKVNELLKKDKERLEALRIEQEKIRKKLEEDRLKREEERLKREEATKAIKNTISKYIQQGKTVTATIEKWLLQEGYGFANVSVNERNGAKGTQSIFVHKSFVTSKERKHLRKGTSFQCQLKWESNRPRPKAVNVKLLI